MTSMDISLIINNKNEYPDTAAFRRDLARAARRSLREGDFYDAIRAYSELGNKRRVNEIGSRCVDEGHVQDALDAFRFTRNRRGFARILSNTEFCADVYDVDNELLWNYLGEERRAKFFELLSEYRKQHGYPDRGSFSVSAAITTAKHLRQKFDIAVGIPRGGLFSAFVLDLFGWPTYLLEAHNHKNEGTKQWVKKPEDADIRDKRVLICDKDCVSGRTLRLVVDELRTAGARELGVYFNYDEIPPFSMGIGAVVANVPPEIKSVYTPARIGHDGLMDAARELEARL